MGAAPGTRRRDRCPSQLAGKESREHDDDAGLLASFGGRGAWELKHGRPFHVVTANGRAFERTETVSLSPNSGQGFAPRTATRGTGPYAAAGEDRAWLSLPTGRVVAADPITFGFGDPPLPFAQTVLPGRYPVDLLIEHGCVAAARLIIRDEPATSWEPTVPDGRVPGEHDRDNAGYEVESGIGCFTDDESLRRLCADDSGEWQQDLMLDVADRPTGATALVRSDLDDEQVLIAFRTGEGDGAYTTWAGRNANGDITCFVTEFTGPHPLAPTVTLPAMP
jgi:hypothetical protein